jgi:hypothetical protein
MLGHLPTDNSIMGRNARGEVQRRILQTSISEFEDLLAGLCVDDNGRFVIAASETNVCRSVQDSVDVLDPVIIVAVGYAEFSFSNVALDSHYSIAHVFGPRLPLSHLGLELLSRRITAED